MAAYAPPRVILSSPSSTVVVTSSALPSWVPAPGQFNTIYRADAPGTVHLATAINPEVFNADGSARTAYRGGSNNPGVFSQNTDDFNQIWGAQNGGAFNPLVGAQGSLMLWGGGHGGWCGTGTISFDIATGMWSNYTYPIYANFEKSVIGGTVATETGHLIKPPTAPQDSDSVNNRASAVGNYIKMLDDTPIPGAGASNGGPVPYGSDVTLWQPIPFHTNCGAAYLPPDAGGGPLGSLIYAGHDQSNVRVEAAKSQVFRFDCATKTWSAKLYGDIAIDGLNSSVTPALEYDPKRKVMWVMFPKNMQPVKLDYKTSPPTFTKPGGNWVSLVTIMCNLTYVPSRDIMVSLSSGGDVPASNTIKPAPAGSSADGSRRRYPLITVWKLSTAVTPTYNVTTVATNPPSGATYVNHMLAGTDTGWPGFRSEISGRSGESELRSAELTFNGYEDLSKQNTCYKGANGVKLKDSAGIMCGIFDQWAQDTRGAADRLEYSPIDDCLIYLDVINPACTYLKLWKLKMPAVGRELLDPWTWEKEYIDQPNSTTFPQTPVTTFLPQWGGRTRYVDALKCLIYSDGVSTGVGAVRSATWE